MAARKVSPAAEDTPKAPLLDLEAIEQRFRTPSLRANPPAFTKRRFTTGLNARTRRRDASMGSWPPLSG